MAFMMGRIGFGLFKLLYPGFECIEKSVIFRIQ